MAKQRKKTKKEKQRSQEIRRQRKREREKAQFEFELESDETFAFIAGYTEGGVPYGVTHEEMAEIEKLEKLDFGFQFFELEFEDDWADSFIDNDEFDFEYEWLNPMDRELAVQLLVEQEKKPVIWENSDSYDPSFDWDNYFGLKGKEDTREELIHHLNLFDLLKEMRRKR
ncbi:hypothetical protein [Mesobacillus boroniphilus]|uniref:Uncharacterized protein n=1 Tax=Mesobacillus boroniphilus JCM 21738 TaxID=1294265 RepID=W4RLK0_9BACI|nr:hypothetical protein [Mesobacillus boroniphilus]GAE44768.1 hypothetical protein JCM21738_1507 [Mesobacillus boroniphilus JCM 21738]